MAKIGRNDPCPCGSGLKYKQCCLQRQQGMSPRMRLVAALIGLVLVTGAVLALFWDPGTEQRRVWSEEHGHWHTVP